MKQLYTSLGGASRWALAALLGLGGLTAQAQTCTTPVSTFPYVENFDGVTSPALPACVTVLDVNADNNTWGNRGTLSNGTNLSASQPNAMVYIYNPNGTSAGNDWFFTPALQLRAGYRYQVSFAYRGGGIATYPEKLEVKYGTAATVAGQTTTLWQKTDITSGTYTTAGASATATNPAVTTIEPTANGTYYVGFHVYSDPDEYLLAIDNIQITETAVALPSCAEPTNLTIGTITPTSAAISFTGATGASSYGVVYGPTGFNPYSAGTTVTPAPTASPYTITGLTPATSYEAYVRTTCAATNQSVFTGPVKFYVPCVTPTIATFPYSENFDAVPTGINACGISVLDANNDNNTWASTSTLATSTGTTSLSSSAPNAMVYFYNEDGTTAANDWFFTPPLLLRAGYRYRLTFKYRVASATFAEAMEVKYGTAATAAGQTTTLWSRTNLTNTTYATANNTSSPAVVDITPTTNGSYYIGFHAISAADKFFLAVDDVQVADVTSLAASPELARAVSVYPNPSAGRFSVEVKGANAAQGLQVEVTNMLGQKVHTATVRDNMTNQLNLSQLANGLYTLRLSNGGEYTVQTISIQK